MSKTGLIVSGCIVLALAGLSLFLKFSLSAAEGKLADLKQEFADQRRAWETEKTDLSVKLAERDRRIEALEQQERDLGRLGEELAGLKTSLGEKETALAAKDERIAELVGETKTLKGERAKAQELLEAQRKVHGDVVGELAEAKQSVADLTEQLNGARERNKELEKELTVAETKAQRLAVEAEKLRRLAPELTGEEIVGTVEELPAPDKLIISELSATPEVGLEFSVFRGAEFLARARVYRVFEKYAGARVTFLQEGREIRPGDAVKTGF
jgi:chromosome segregation ATPase